MAPSFDWYSNLFCAEDASIFEEDEFVDSMDMLDYQIQNYGDPNPNWLLPLQSDECVALMVEEERNHLPGGDYVNKLKTGDLDFGARKEAVDWIEKVRAHFSFGPLCAYLSINYLDRFLSSYEFPSQKQSAWTMPLLALACLSLAAKIDEPKVPLSLDFQMGEPKFVFESKTIQKMELMVLSTLKWRMQAITPFSFIDNFISKISDDEKTRGASILKAVQLILSTARGIDFLEFRSSEIAAAVAISVVGETQAEKAISVLIQHVEKERVLKCVEMIRELSSGSDSTKDASAASVSVSVPQSPIGVLGAECFSFKTDDTTNAGSCANSTHNNSPDAKRRKLNTTFGV